MTKQEFIDKLKNELKDETYETVIQTVTYYEEMIDDYVEDGIEEGEAVAKLGNMKEILASIHAQDTIEIRKINKSSSVVLTVLLILGFPLWASLVAAGACMLLSFYIVLWCVPIITVSLGLGGFCAFAVGLFGSFPLFSQSVSLGVTQLGVSALFAAISIIGFYLTYIVSGKIVIYTKSTNVKVKAWIVDTLRRVGVVC